MKSLRTLIRLQKQRVDELRKKMAALETKKFALIEQSEIKARELDHELSLASEQVEMSGFFGDFAERIRSQREAIAEDIKRVQIEIDDLQNLVREAFGELKKLEHAEEQRKLRAKQAADAKESKDLDEVAIAQYVRKEDVE